MIPDYKNILILKPWRRSLKKTLAREKEVIMSSFSFKNPCKGSFGVFAGEKEVFMSIKL